MVPLKLCVREGHFLTRTGTADAALLSGVWRATAPELRGLSVTSALLIYGDGTFDVQHSHTYAVATYLRLVASSQVFLAGRSLLESAKIVTAAFQRGLSGGKLNANLPDEAGVAFWIGRSLWDVIEKAGMDRLASGACPPFSLATKRVG